MPNLLRVIHAQKNRTGRKRIKNQLIFQFFSNKNVRQRRKRV
jgi:hypothetical protein